MGKKILSFGLIVFLVTLQFLSGCISEQNTQTTDISSENIQLEADLKNFVNSSNDFTFSLYSKLNENNENLFFSPYSITLALAMAAEGAGGQTKEEMTTVLDLPTNDSNRHLLIKSVAEQLSAQKQTANISIANAYWLTENGELKSAYQETIETFYLAYGEKLDFSGDSAGSAETINDWIEQKTNNKIKDLLSAGDISAATYLILTNAIYFKADWKYQFDENSTENKTFTSTDTTTLETPMMHMKDETKLLDYVEDEYTQLLQLDYDDENYSMYILLPKENISVLESQMSSTYLKELQMELSSNYVEVFLPTFSFEQKYNLGAPLISLGMNTAFSSQADFSNISDYPLQLSGVIHQSYIKADEQGTEAAAATATILATSYPGEEPNTPILFEADHPFIFFIQHQHTGQILFMGKVETPNP